MEVLTENKEELTPELKAEILGETMPEAEPPAAEPSTEGKETLKAGEPTTTPGEEPKAAEKTPAPEQDKKPEVSEQTFKQSEVEKMIQDRIGNALQENQQLKERLQTLEQSPSPRQPQQSKDPADMDLGRIFHDPEWNGWTLRKLKEAGYEEQYQVAVSRLESVKQYNILRQEEVKEQQEREYGIKYDKEVTDLKKMDPDMVDPITGKLNHKGKELADWGADNGIFNLPLIYKIRNFDALLEKAKKDGVTEYLSNLGSKQGVRRAGDGGSAPVVTANLDALNDEQLQEAYVASVPGSSQRKTIEAKLEARGIF